MEKFKFNIENTDSSLEKQENIEEKYRNMDLSELKTELKKNSKDTFNFYQLRMSGMDLLLKQKPEALDGIIDKIEKHKNNANGELSEKDIQNIFNSEFDDPSSLAKETIDNLVKNNENANEYNSRVSQLTKLSKQEYNEFWKSTPDGLENNILRLKDNPELKEKYVASNFDSSLFEDQIFSTISEKIKPALEEKIKNEINELQKKLEKIKKEKNQILGQIEIFHVKDEVISFLENKYEEEIKKTEELINKEVFYYEQNFGKKHKPESLSDNI